MRKILNTSHQPVSSLWTVLSTLSHTVSKVLAQGRYVMIIQAQFKLGLHIGIQSWSSAEVNWARRSVAAEEVQHVLRTENAELAKQVSIWQTKFETLQ